MWQHVISGILVATGLALAATYLNEPVERVHTSIEAATDVPENGLPVYAQFVVAQQVTLPKETDIVALEVPIWSPQEGVTINIALQDGSRDGVRAQSQHLTHSTGGHETVSMPGVAEVYEAGVYDVVLEVPAVTHETRERAPRVFVETADTHYGGGNYRIAANEKKGDMALTLTESVFRWWLLQERWSDSFLKLAQDILVLVLLVLLIWQLPFLIFRGAERTNPDTTSQTE